MKQMPADYENDVPLQLAEMDDALIFCTDVFKRFDGWMYETIREKWTIGVRVCIRSYLIYH